MFTNCPKSFQIWFGIPLIGGLLRLKTRLDIRSYDLLIVFPLTFRRDMAVSHQLIGEIFIVMHEGHLKKQKHGCVSSHPTKNYRREWDLWIPENHRRTRPKAQCFYQKYEIIEWHQSKFQVSSFQFPVSSFKFPVSYPQPLNYTVKIILSKTIVRKEKICA